MDPNVFSALSKKLMCSFGCDSRKIVYRDSESDSSRRIGIISNFSIIINSENIFCCDPTMLTSMLCIFCANSRIHFVTGATYELNDLLQSTFFLISIVERKNNSKHKQCNYMSCHIHFNVISMMINSWNLRAWITFIKNYYFSLYAWTLKMSSVLMREKKTRTICKCIFRSRYRQKNLVRMTETLLIPGQLEAKRLPSCSHRFEAIVY